MIGKKSFYFLWVFYLSIYAQVTIDIDLTDQQIFYGESSQLQVMVNGGDESSQIGMDELRKNFVVENVGSQSKNMSSVRIINNQITREEFRGHLFVYNLTPKSAGNYKIGPLNVIYDGKEYQSNSRYLNVTGVEKGEHIFIKMHTNEKEYILGEKFSINIDIYIKTPENASRDIEPLLHDRPPSLKIPWLEEEINGLKRDDLSRILRPFIVSNSKLGFHLNDINVQDNSLFSVFESTKAKFMFPKVLVEEISPIGTKNEYMKYSFAHSFDAEKEGNYVLGPVLLKGFILSKVINSRSGESKRIVVTAEPITIKVKSPPLENRPLYYYGAIGKFKIMTEVLNTQAHVGDLLDLVVTIEGEGLLENISPPKISEQEQINKHFKIYDDNVNSTTSTKTKKFQYSVRVNEIVNSFPPIHFCYFDTEKRDYVTIKTKEIPLKIVKADIIPTEEILGNVDTLSENSVVTKIDEGIYENYEKADGVNTIRSNVLIWYRIIFIGMPFAYLFFLSIAVYRNRWGNNIVFQRKRRAFKKAKSALEACKNMPLDQQCIKLTNVIKGYVADHFNLNEQTLVSGELLNIVKVHISSETYEKLKNFLDTSEAIQYGGGSDLETYQKNIMDILCDLEKKLGRTVENV